MRAAEGQGALFEVAGAPTKSKRRRPEDDIVPVYAPGEPRPWDVQGSEDERRGWEYRYVTPARALEIRKEIEHGHR